MVQGIRATLGLRKTASAGTAPFNPAGFDLSPIA